MSFSAKFSSTVWSTVISASSELLFYVVAPRKTLSVWCFALLFLVGSRLSVDNWLLNDKREGSMLYFFASLFWAKYNLLQISDDKLIFAHLLVPRILTDYLTQTLLVKS